MRSVGGHRLRDAHRHPLLLLAILAYVPILLTQPGKVSADTKSYLTIDPSRMLSRAWSMWDPHVGAGTITHQNVGYLFPLGPYYWVMDRIGVPDWVTQRLLWGTLVFAAAAGVWALARSLGWATAPALVAALAYGWTPYLLSYLARLSALLGPWSALPWMILLLNRCVRERSWRAPALFALVIALVGSVNATALLYAGLGPVLWILTDLAAGRLRWRPVLGGVLRAGALAAVVSTWWVIGLRVQGTYGLPILKFTETYQAVASSSTPPEILRGLGYWFFYGGDRLGPWVGPAGPYVSNPLLIALGFILAGLALLGLCSRFTGRSHAGVMLLVGLGISVAAAPLSHPSPYGNLFLRLTDSAIGMAMRSTPRAAPLVVLALALGLGNVAHQAAQWRASSPLRAVTRHSPTIVSVAILVQLWPWFTGAALTSSILRDEHLPTERVQLADWLDAHGTSRVYELPAADFANYRWGGTVDPVLPGMIDRPTIARELVPQGGMGTAELLNALEHRIYEGVFEPTSLGPIAHLLGAGTIVVRNDLQHERYRLARPRQLWQDITTALGQPAYAGPTITDQPSIPFTDELTLAHQDAPTHYPVLSAFDLDPNQPIAELAAASSPIVLVGNGDGVVDAAAAGLVDGSRPIVYDATAATDPTALAGATDPWVIVTDTNRRQAMRWSTVGSNYGALEQAGETPLQTDPADSRLTTLPDDDRYRTVLQLTGTIRSVQANGYGNKISLTPEDAPINAVDGDPSTAWRGAVFQPTTGLRLRIELSHPITVPSIRLLQPITGARHRTITQVDVVLDGTTRFRATLDGRSLTVPGQDVPMPNRPFHTLDLVVRGDNTGKLADYAGAPGVGFAEVTIPGVHLDATVATPRIASVTPTSASRLSYVLSRVRLDPATPNRTDPEPFMDRVIDVPSARGFVLTGQARLSAAAPDSVVDSAIGTARDGWTATSSARLPGSPASRAGAAIDTDPATAWQTPIDDVVGASLTLHAPSHTTVSQLRVGWLDDGSHSLPTKLRITSDTGGARTVDLTKVSGGAVDFTPLDGTSFTLTIDAIDAVTTASYFSGLRQVLPVALTDVRFDTSTPTPVTSGSPVPAACRSDLVTLDGQPLPVRIEGTVGNALHRDELIVRACAPVLQLSAGTHRLRTAKGADTGIDLDRLVLDSSPVAAAAPADAALPPVQSLHTDATTTTMILPATSGESLLLFRQSWNAGWRATLDGADLGAPVLVDGYASAWHVPAGPAGRAVRIVWTPQRTVLVGEFVSAAALVLIVLLALPIPWPRRRTRQPVDHGTSRALGARPRRILLVGGLWIMGGIPAAITSVVVQVLPRTRRWRAPAIIVCAGGICAGWIVAKQAYYGYPSGPDWPSRFAVVTPFAWAAAAAAITAALAPGDDSDQPADDTERHTSSTTSS